jgi:hypothetical protein
MEATTDEDWSRQIVSTRNQEVHPAAVGSTVATGFLKCV